MADYNEHKKAKQPKHRPKSWSTNKHTSLEQFHTKQVNELTVFPDAVAKK